MWSVITHSDTASGQTDEYDNDCELGSASLSSSVRKVMCASVTSGSNTFNQSECQCCSEPDIPFHSSDLTESCVLHIYKYKKSNY